MLDVSIVINVLPQDRATPTGGLVVLECACGCGTVARLLWEIEDAPASSRQAVSVWLQALADLAGDRPRKQPRRLYLLHRTDLGGVCPLLDSAPVLWMDEAEQVLRALVPKRRISGAKRLRRTDQEFLRRGGLGEIAPL